MRTRTGLIALTVAGLLATTGCGSRASDAEIAEAIRGPGVTDTQPVGSIAGDAEAGIGTISPGADAGVASQPQSTGTTSTASAGGPKGTTGSPSKTDATGSGAQTTTSGATTPGLADKSEIRIGQIGPWSGVLGAMASVGPKALAAWVANTNARGGVNGHPVRVIVGDDQGDPGTTMTLAKRMVEGDRILAFVNSAVVFGYPQFEKYAREKGVPVIGGEMTDPGGLTSTNSFPVTTSVLNQAIAGLKTLVAQGGSRIGIFYCLEVSAMCSYLAEGVKSSPEVGSKVVESMQVSLVAPTYTSQCLRMKSANVDVLWLGMDGPAAARAAKDCATQGFKPKTVLLSLNATKETPTMPNLSGSVIPAGFVPPVVAGVPGLDQYRQVMATYAPSVTHTGWTMLGWAAGQMFGLAGKELPDQPTSADLYRGLYKIKKETLGGLITEVTYLQGKPPQVKPCVFTWGMSGGAWAAPDGAKPQC